MTVAKTKEGQSESPSRNDYVETRFAQGHQRTYGYPQNGVPDVYVESEMIETSFIVARRATRESSR
jgi:protein subunit release factor A